PRVRRWARRCQLRYVMTNLSMYNSTPLWVVACQKLGIEHWFVNYAAGVFPVVYGDENETRHVSPVWRFLSADKIVVWDTRHKAHLEWLGISPNRILVAGP